MTPAPLPLPDPPLADGVIALRLWTPVDVAVIAAAYQDPAIWRFSWPHDRPYTVEDAHAYLVESARLRSAGRALELAVASVGGPDEPLGVVSLYDVDRDQARAWLGYWIVPAARGRGVATRAARLLARWGFDALGLARIELTCGPDNHISQRVAERCGFTREGLLRSHIRFKGGRRDTVVYGLLPGELR
jgi:RimJ/RimL family protein N-acetyltransferase